MTHVVFGSGVEVWPCAVELFPAIEAADKAFAACNGTIQARQGPTSTVTQQLGAAASAEGVGEDSSTEANVAVAARLRAVRRFLGLWATEAELLEVYDMWDEAGQDEARRIVQARVAKVEASFWRDNLPGHVDAASMPLGPQYVSRKVLYCTVQSCIASYCVNGVPTRVICQPRHAW